MVHSSVVQYIGGRLRGAVVQDAVVQSAMGRVQYAVVLNAECSA